MYEQLYTDDDWRKCTYCHQVHRNKLQYTYAMRPVHSAPIVKLGITADEITTRNKVTLDMRREVACAANCEHDNAYTSIFNSADWQQTNNIYTPISVLLGLIFVCILACAFVECVQPETTVLTQLVWMVVGVALCVIAIAIGVCMLHGRGGHFISANTTDTVLAAVIEYKITQLAHMNLNIVDNRTDSPEVHMARQAIKHGLGIGKTIHEQYDAITKLLTIAHLARID